MANTNGDHKIKDTHDKYTDAYVNILNAYKDQISDSVKKRNELKEKFFDTIKLIMQSLTWIFAGTLFMSLVIFIVMVFTNYNSVAIITGAITTILSSFATMILSIFKLPKIIASYLFNKKEDKLMSQIIENIQKYEIDAVKYELGNLKLDLDKLKLEKLKALNSGVAVPPDYSIEDSDNDLEDSTYGIPPQNPENDLSETSS